MKWEDAYQLPSALRRELAELRQENHDLWARVAKLEEKIDHDLQASNAADKIYTKALHRVANIEAFLGIWPEPQKPPESEVVKP